MQIVLESCQEEVVANLKLLENVIGQAVGPSLWSLTQATTSYLMPVWFAT